MEKETYAPDEPRVFITSDTSVIKTNPKNRNYNHKRVADFVNSFKRNKTVPTLSVTRDLVLLDGEHRYQAIKKYNEEMADISGPLKFSVTVDPYSDTNKIAVYNSSQQQWSTSEWLDFYCKLGYPEYIKAQKIIDEYSINFSLLMYINNGSVHRTIINKDVFKGGDMEINLEGFDAKYREIKKIADYANIQIKPGFVLAIIPLINDSDYSPDRMFTKLDLNSRLLRGCTSTTAYREALSEIYNYKQHFNIFRYSNTEKKKKGK